MLMVPEHHHLSLIKTHTVHDPASGRGATLSESPPSAPGTPDFTDYVEDGRLHSSCIDENFLNAATWSCQRHAQPQRSQQSQPLQYGKVKLLRKATQAHVNTVAEIGAAMISTGNRSMRQVTVSAGSTQLWPKASRQTSTAAFSPASEAASPDRAGFQALWSQAVSQHHDLTTAQQPLSMLSHPRLSTLTGSGSADSIHAQAASNDSKHLESLLSLAMAEYNDAAVAAAQPQPQTPAQPYRLEAPSVSAGSNTNHQQHSLRSPAQNTMRSLLTGQGQVRRSHG
ncbi:TPA: hypothetical protein ACH3X1_010028 [Trebouxia sp. C0004]